MVKEYLAFNQELAVEDVLSDLRRNRTQYVDYDVQYSYVIDAQGRLTGVLRLRDVVLAPPDRSLLQVMMLEPESVSVETGLTELHDYFERNSYVGVPVVDEGEMLVGVVLRSDAHRAESRQAEETYLESTGIVGGEELRSMGFLRRSSRRLSWLSINIVLNLLAASVIALYQDTLSAVIVLAVFLPIISDMSGCSGNQAVAVSIRELTLGTTVPRDIFRVLWKEWIIGLGNGLVLGALIGAAAYLWQGNLYLSAVVGGALALNTLIARTPRRHRSPGPAQLEDGPCSRLGPYPHHRDGRMRVLPHPQLCRRRNRSPPVTCQQTGLTATHSSHRFQPHRPIPQFLNSFNSLVP